MNRPDEERQAAAEWVNAKQLVAPERLRDNSRAVGDAAQPLSLAAVLMGGAGFDTLALCTDDT